MKRETPADAPAVRNMWFGLEGYPSRSGAPSQSCAAQTFTSFFFRTFDEICDGFPDEGDTLGVRVRADGANLGEQLLSTLNHV